MPTHYLDKVLRGIPFTRLMHRRPISWIPGERMAHSVAERTGVLRGRARPPTDAGMRRIRLLNQIVGPAAPRLTLVVAPAGCGKTTLLGHVAQAAAPRAAWLTLDQDLTTTSVFLAHVQACFGRIPELRGAPWTSADDLVNALESRLTERVVLILDDLQVLTDSPALAVVRLLLAHQPEQLGLVFGSRGSVNIGLERHRLTSTVRDIGAEDLRFRTWEVEELFRTCHHVRLGSGEVAQITQRTAGWAAGLQLFHLATAGRPPSARTVLLAGVGSGRLTSRYLAEQVLAQLDGPALDFVLRTSVLARLSAKRCDQLLQRTDSTTFLIRLDRAGILVGGEDLLGAGTDEYRYHEVLQTHLLAQLEARLGAAAARDLHRRAGELWKAESVYADAVRALSLAQDWDGVRETIEVGGRELADDRGPWLDLLPDAMQRSDPWVALAMARRLLADGSMQAAVRGYERAVQNFDGLSGTDLAARELSAVRAWVDPPLGTVDDPIHQIRLAFIDPRLVARPTDRSTIRWCAYGMACMTAGRLPEAAEAFEIALGEPGAPAAIEAVAVLAHAMTLSLSGDPRAAEARRNAGLVSASVELPVLERIGDGLIRLLGRRGGGDPGQVVGDLLAACRATGDPWGEALLLYSATMRGLTSGRTSVEAAHRAASQLRALGAPALATWASAAEAVVAAQSGNGWPSEDLAKLERAAIAVGAGPHALALLAVEQSAADPEAARRAGENSSILLERTALRGWIDRVRAAGRRRRPTAIPRQRRPPVEVVPVATLRVRVLGTFSVTLNGTRLVSDGLRPLHRELFAVFCAHAGQIINRDQLVEWFWPDSDPARASHSLQVAVHELRRLLNPQGDRTAAVGLQRTGPGYRLQLTTATDCDARQLEHLVRQAAATEGEGDVALAANLLDAAVTLYQGDLVPHVGYPEWVLAERDRLRQVAVGAFGTLVELRAAAGRHRDAVAAARAGLAHDRYSDGLWRQLVTSLLALDEKAAAAATQRSYHDLLVELGMPSG